MSAARLALLAPLLAPASVHAEVSAQCHVVNVQLQPHSSDLQIVAWIDDAAGNYQSTIFITQTTGTFGLGNRPGRFDFNSGPTPSDTKKDMWPYGRRITTFPVWSHHHGLTFPQVVFQNGDEDNLSHSFTQSSREMHFCRPQSPSEPAWDAGTCASTVYTDKGVFSSATTGYPPRNDVTRMAGLDSDSVAMYGALNPFDAVSMATPPGGALTEINWPIPPGLPTGDYVLWLEVAKEFDFNATYNPTRFPSPTGIQWSDYGKPYRGQPSVLYSVPFSITTTESINTTKQYVGYGDPTGASGTMNAAVFDGTITTDTPGTGASRLDILAGADYRVMVDARPEFDDVAPGMPSHMQEQAVTNQTLTVAFTAPGDDGTVGKVTGYEIRVRANDEMTAANFAQSTIVTTNVVPTAPGNTQMVQVEGLLPETDYWVGIRAYDDCHNTSDVVIQKFHTADRLAGEVNACFIATAAYGSIMANDVEMLRHFRDAAMRSSVLGELAIESYYTFGPALAGVIGESDLLRTTTRDALAPIVAWTRAFSL
jgi:hypothetical protein